MTFDSTDWMDRWIEDMLTDPIGQQGYGAFEHLRANGTSEDHGYYDLEVGQ